MVDLYVCVDGKWRFDEIVPAQPATESDLDQVTVDFYHTSLGSLMCDYDFTVANTVAGQTLDHATFDTLCGDTTTATSPPSADAILPVEFDAVLTAPANAWLNQPSGPGFDELSAAVTQLVNAGRPFSAPAPLAQKDVIAELEYLKGYPGNDTAVAHALDVLRPMMPGLTPIVRAGSLTVGVDIAPGRYRTVAPVEDCYWETLDNAGEINDNNFVNAAPQVIMTVRSRDFAVNTEDCGLWVKIG